MEDRWLEIKNEDEHCTSSYSSSTIPLTSGIEEAPQLLLSVTYLYHNSPRQCNRVSKINPQLVITGPKSLYLRRFVQFKS